MRIEPIFHNTKILITLVVLGYLLLISFCCTKLVIAQNDQIDNSTNQVVEPNTFTQTVDITSTYSLSPTFNLTTTSVPVPTSVPLQPASWRSRTSSRIPIRLQRTVYVGGGGGGLYDCSSENRFKNLPPIWHIDSEYITLTTYPDNNQPSRYFLIWSCRHNSGESIEAKLIWPDGSQTLLSNETENTSSTYSDLSIYKTHHIFDRNMPDGKYLISIRDQHGSLTRSIRFTKNVHSGTYIILSKNNTSSTDPQYIFEQGSTLNIRYSGYRGNEYVEVGLYGLNSDTERVHYMLLNSWNIQVDNLGSFQQNLQIPDDAVAGNYILAATGTQGLERKLAGSSSEPSMLKSSPSFTYFQKSFRVARRQDNSSPTPIPVIVLPPLETAKSFYAALDEGIKTGDFQTVYSLLSRERQAQRSYQELQSLYSDVQAVEVESIQLIESNVDQATVRAIVKLTSNDQGPSIAYYDVLYQIVLENSLWRMDSYESTVLAQ